MLLSWNARHFNNNVAACEAPNRKKMPKNSGLVISRKKITARRFPAAVPQHNRIRSFKSDNPTQ
ncbi:hypothetical protein [Pseudomonas sp. NBRC 111119]|uniref:hypothetical protein n=1 Tax=Pseudomonas sp. NBRC 111119 TaxID=1661034 RepID=UPI0012E21E61|nr:hypothetical protein [Pseudomonas sp. NBRC 111119]